MKDGQLVEKVPEFPTTIPEVKQEYTVRVPCTIFRKTKIIASSPEEAMYLYLDGTERPFKDEFWNYSEDKYVEWGDHGHVSFSAEQISKICRKFESYKETAG